MTKENKKYTLLEKFYNGRDYFITMSLINASIALTNSYLLGFIILNIMMFIMFLKLEDFRTPKK